MKLFRLVQPAEIVARPALFFALFCALLFSGSALRVEAQSADALARLTALEGELALLETEIVELEDVKSIKRLQRAYGYYVDKALTSEVIQLFSEEATAEIAQLGVFVGKDRIAELYGTLLGEGLRLGQLNNHMILQGVVTINPGGQTAKGRWRAVIQLGEHGESAHWSEGPYENEYVKEDGVWRISKLHWYTTVTAPYAPGWHLETVPIAGQLENLPPDEPPTEIYDAYPSAYLPPYHYDNPVSGRPAPSGAEE